MPISQIIARELGVREAQVVATMALLDEGASVPFVARYRKEATGGLDDTQLRQLDERLRYLRELEERRTAVLASIEEQGKLTPELRQEVENAETKQRLEDLYLPYKQKRRTKAQIAREAGIEPLALALLDNPELTPEAEAESYLNADAGFADTKAVLDGARQILMEKFAEDAELLQTLRTYLLEHGHLKSSVIEGKENEGAKFRDWFDFAEAIATFPRTAPWPFCAGAMKASSISPWCSIPNWRPMTASRPATPASNVSRPASASARKTVRQTNGWPIPCAGPGK